MAQVIVRDLLQSKDIDAVGIAEVNYNAAQKFANQLGSTKAIVSKVDVRDPKGMQRLLSEYDVVVNAAWYQFNPLVMEVAIRAGAHYLDLGGLYHMTLKQLELDRSVADAGLTCTLGIGSTSFIVNSATALVVCRPDGNKNLEFVPPNRIQNTKGTLINFDAHFNHKTCTHGVGVS